LPAKATLHRSRLHLLESGDGQVVYSLRLSSEFTIL